MCSLARDNTKEICQSVFKVGTDGSKFMEYPCLDCRQRQRLYFEKEGVVTFSKNIRGRRDFFPEAKRGEDFFQEKIRGRRLFSSKNQGAKTFF